LATTLILRLTGARPSWSRERITAVSWLQATTSTNPQPSTSNEPTTGESIREYCYAHGIDVQAITLPCILTFTIHQLQLESGSSAQTLFYMHGGGYTRPLSSRGHMPLVLASARAADVGTVVLLEYTLAPALRYPGQLLQAVQALRYLLRTRRPSQIIVGGDSSGANLALALLAHLKTRQPDAPRLKLDEPFRAVYFLSPHVRLTATSRSVTANQKYDYVRPKLFRTMQRLWRPKADRWAEPLSAPPGFWDKMPAKRALFTAGGWEAVLDDIVELAERCGAKEFGSNSPVELTVGKEEVHTQCLIDAAIGVRDGQTHRDLMAWLGTC